ncbi:Inositol monophosphatase synthesis enzyme [Devosia sp. LC5]|uniref:inositol monophosphatase family protein n=1 Tax=Devosia sp. LC5 TaxID=1502724 RepID=UPI0004E39505|nr:inositol monophosphatase [Devosia sp. LC5]KFC69178.1 Inositol monophosphatase synthesis enzyme [Devosia sp. LC5]
MSVDIGALAAILRDAAKAEVLPRFRRLDAGMVKVKTSAIDLVTEADEAAERFIKARVADLAPDALFVGEESVAADPALLDALADADLAVVVDPIDGTANYAAGLPLFAVMAAVVSKGETIAGIIYDPMGDDWMMAEKGSGAWLRRPNGEAVRMQIAAPLPLADMVGCCSVAFMPAVSRPQVLANFAKLAVVSNYRVAGHEYRTFVSGHAQFLCYNKLMPWDHLAGTLMAQEAGGYAARLDGSPYLPHHVDGGLIIATDKDSWQQLRREVFTY